MLRITDSIKSEEYKCFKNVLHYKCNEEPLYNYTIECDCEEYPNSKSENIYFILETPNHEAFSHWVYENSTWLPLFLLLKKRYPSCLLVIERMKDFKKLFFEKYRIPDNSIVLRDTMKEDNYCFFHTYTSLNDKEIPEIYYKNVSNYFTQLPSKPFTKEISILYLPRGTKENLQGPNNRLYNIQDDVKRLVNELGGVIYETDKTTLLDQQIDIVRKSKVILLDYGSNLWVNGCFAEDSVILCLNIGWEHHLLFPSLGYVWNHIESLNVIKQIYAENKETITLENVPVVSFDFDLVKKTLLSAVETFADTLYLKF